LKKLSGMGLVPTAAFAHTSKCASSPSAPASTSQTVDPLAVVRTETASDNPQADEAPFPVTAVMFVDAALPHPGCSWRAWVLTGLAEEIGSGVEEPILAAAVEPRFSGQAPWPAA
jgi:hypothetical protein